MTIQQFTTVPPLPLPSPTTWQGRRDYRRARRAAREIELSACQSIFIDQRPKSARRSRWGFSYPLCSLAFLLLLFIARMFIFPDLLLAILITFSIVLIPFSLIALGYTIYDRTFFHCEQAHLYTNGFVYIDSRGRTSAARWDQLSFFRRGGHEKDKPSGRIHWDTINATLSNARNTRQLVIAPKLRESTEICALIERGYTDFWLARQQEQLAAGEVLTFDALFLHRDWLGKSTARHRYSASFIRPPNPSAAEHTPSTGMFQGIITQLDETTRVEWLKRADVKSIRVDDRHIFIRTIEPVRRDQQGRSDRLWLQLDTLGLKDAAILKKILQED